MSRRAGIWGVVLLAALMARGAEQGAPLEKSKAELKALHKGPGVPGGDTALGGLREAMPQIQSPLLDSGPVDPAMQPKNSERELKKKKDAQKNWLLEGMNQLDKNSKNKGNDPADKLPGDTNDTDQLQPNQPETIIQLYSEQQQKDETRAGAKPGTTGRTDPLAPFLQGWLAGSPVRGKFFDEYVRKPESAPADGAPPAVDAPDSAVNSGPLTLEAGPPGSRNEPAGASPAANPYLQDFDVSALREASPASAPSPALPAFQPAGNPLPTSLAEPAPVARPPDKKMPLPDWLEDKKYFPQLNKF